MATPKSAAVVPPTLPAPTVAPAPPSGTAPAAGPPLTGRDLAEFRARKGLTLREAAGLLGSLSGTVSKAISAAEKPLPEKLQIALKATLNN